jgi:hypothetical protein
MHNYILNIRYYIYIYIRIYIYIYIYAFVCVYSYHEKLGVEECDDTKRKL